MIIFKDSKGRVLTQQDLEGRSGNFRFEIIGRDKVPPEADALHQAARKAGSSGEYHKALNLLDQASKLAPKWPYPVYDSAFTYLLMRDFEKARQFYQKTIEISPRGFFTAITALNTLTKEKNGKLPSGTYLAYTSLEWIDDPVKKESSIRALVTQLPSFAPGWKELSFIQRDDSETLKSITKALECDPDAETKGILTINKALILHRKGHQSDAIALLANLALDPGSTYATEHMAKATLAQIHKH